MTQTTGQAEITRGDGTAIARRVPIEEREVVYTPFQGSEKITLTAGMVIKFLCRPTKRGATCSPEHAVRFMMLCKARALNPWEGDAYLIGFDGQDGPEFNLITAHQAFLKRAEAHPEFEGMESGVMLVDDNGVMTESQGDFVPPRSQLVGGWAKVYRKDRTIPCYRRLNLQVFNKGYGQWQKNPQGMITKCSECDALRSSFPNSLAGMFAEEEMGPTRVESRDAAAPSGSKIADLERRLTDRPVSEGQRFVPDLEAARVDDEAIPATQADVPADPVQSHPDAGTAAESQAQEPPKRIPIKAPASSAFLSHAGLMAAIYAAIPELQITEADATAWLTLALGDAATNRKAQDAMKPAARHSMFVGFVEQFGGEAK